MDPSGDPITPAIYVAHLIDHAGRSRYVEYTDLIIDVITVLRDAPLSTRRFVRTDPPEHDDLGLPIFRERAD